MSTITLTDSVHNIDATDSDLATSRFEDVRLAGSTFTEVTFADSKFENVLMDGCSFRRASFAYVTLEHCEYDGMKIDGVEVKAMLEAYRSARGTRENEGGGSP